MADIPADPQDPDAGSPPGGPLRWETPAVEAVAAVDTGSDTWWRRQLLADQQRAAAAAAAEPVPAVRAAAPPAPPAPPVAAAPAAPAAPAPPAPALPPVQPAAPADPTAPAAAPPAAAAGPAATTPGATTPAVSAPPAGWPPVPPGGELSTAPRRSEASIARALLDETPAASPGPRSSADLSPPLPPRMAASLPPRPSDDWSGGTVTGPTTEAPDWWAESPPPVEEAGRHRRRRRDPGGPVRALAGASVAVAGVLLGIGALLWANSGPGQGSPAVAAGLTQRQLPPSTLPSAAVLVPPAGPAESSAGSPTTAATPSTPPGDVTPADNPVLVLNSSRVARLADRAAGRFRAAGWPVSGIGNLAGHYPRTTLYFAPGQRDAAMSFANRFAGIGAVQPRPPALPGRGLTLVLTSGYRA